MAILSFIITILPTFNKNRNNSILICLLHETTSIREYYILSITHQSYEKKRQFRKLTFINIATTLYVKWFGEIIIKKMFFAMLLTSQIIVVFCPEFFCVVKLRNQRLLGFLQEGMHNHNVYFQGESTSYAGYPTLFFEARRCQCEIFNSQLAGRHLKTQFLYLSDYGNHFLLFHRL